MPPWSRPPLRDRLRSAYSSAQGVIIEQVGGSWLELLAAVRSQDISGVDDLAAALAALAGEGPPEEDEGRLAQALAIAVEGARRSLRLEAFDGQVIAALGLCRGRVVQMQTGEGKTLAAALAASVLAIGRGGLQVLTANDYLARRDAAWMGPLFRLLGPRVASIGQDDDEEGRRTAYAADITYLTARECGFDLLRDQLRAFGAEAVQRPFRSAIVDEADFILVDEARIPLVIAGLSTLDPREALPADSLASTLDEGRDFSVDREGRRAPLSLEGRPRVEEALRGGPAGDPGPEAVERGVARVHAALVARRILSRDVDYVVRDGRVELVDGFTGRVADRRRWPWGVQAALEAKEGLEPGPEGRIYGKLTVRDLAALFPSLAAMTATAEAAAPELSETYGLATLVIPPEKALRRQDLPDLLFATAAEKREALVAAIVETHATGRPILVGTASVRESRELASDLEARGLAPQVLNALNDEGEASVIAGAGRLGALTISTNMAGRGTDIRLGGAEGGEEERRRLEELGGLFVIGTNRHESRRIDDQLRGRAGRQGEPGLSRFFVSLEDPLFLRFGVAEFLPPGLRPTARSPAAPRLADPATASKPRGPLEGRSAHRELARAQAIIEGQNHRLRSRLFRRSLILEFDRRKVRELREAALAEAELPDDVRSSLPPEAPPGLAARAFVRALDAFWADHLEYAEELAEGIGLAGIGGRDPEIEYLRRLAEAFEAGLSELGEATASILEAGSSGGSASAMDALEESGGARPGTTWTYQVDEEPLPAFSLAGLSSAGNLAAAFAAPLLLFVGLLRRIFGISGRGDDGSRP